MSGRAAVLFVLAAVVAGIPLSRPAGAAPDGEGEIVTGVVHFDADLASFPDSVFAPATRLYLSVPLTSLHFTPPDAGGPPTDDVLVTVEIDDAKSGARRGGGAWSYGGIPGAGDPAGNEGRILQKSYRFRLPPGEYRARIRVEEPARGNYGQDETPFTVPDFDHDPVTASDLVFGLCGEMVVVAPRENFEGPVLPHPSRTYGDAAPLLCVYAELADTLASRPDSAYAVKWEIKNQGGRTVAGDRTTVHRVRGRGALLLRPSLDGLTLGAYRLKVWVDLDGGKVEREGSFQIDESRISFAQDSEMIRTVLGYVATNAELIRVDNAPDDSLQGIWDEFWARRDPDPETRQNPALAEFMTRVEYADRHFGVLEPGWRSDMGKIYIKYGAPDRVERVQNDTLGPPTEIWYYYSRNATFVFQDRDGFGRYRLVGTRRD